MPALILKRHCRWKRASLPLRFPVTIHFARRVPALWSKSGRSIRAKTWTSRCGRRATGVVPGCTQIYADALGDAFPPRVSLPKAAGLKQATDLLIDQVRAISNQHFMGTKPLCTPSRNHMKRVEDALQVLIVKVLPPDNRVPAILGLAPALREALDPIQKSQAVRIHYQADQHPNE